MKGNNVQLESSYWKLHTFPGTFIYCELGCSPIYVDMIMK